MCRKDDRALARDLAKAVAPAIGGEIVVRYVEGARPNRLDLFIQSRPRFGSDGVAFFPALERTANDG